MRTTHEGPTKPTRPRRRHSALRRLWNRVWRWLRYIGDSDYARRHDAGKKAGVTRRARKSMAAAHDPRLHDEEVTAIGRCLVCQGTALMATNVGEPTWRIGGLPDLGDELDTASDPRFNDVKIRFDASAPEHHPDCKWSFSITTPDGDFEKATWACVTECAGGPPNTPEPPARRWRASAPEDARSQEIRHSLIRDSQDPAYMESVREGIKEANVRSQQNVNPFGTRNRTS